MHGSMTLDTIEGQGQGHSKVEKSANFNIISANIISYQHKN